MTIRVGDACKVARRFHPSESEGEIVRKLRRHSLEVIVGSLLVADVLTYTRIAAYVMVDDALSRDGVMRVAAAIQHMGQIADRLGLSDDDRLDPVAKVPAPGEEES
jgi:hypothetical protein